MIEFHGSKCGLWEAEYLEWTPAPPFVGCLYVPAAAAPPLKSHLHTHTLSLSSNK